MRYPDSARIPFSSGLPCRKLQSIWMSEPGQGSAAASQLNLFPRPGMTWKQASTLEGRAADGRNLYDDIFLEFVTIPDGEINAHVLNAQSEIRQHSSDNTQSCPDSSSDEVSSAWLFSNFSNSDDYEARALAAKDSERAAAKYIYGRLPAFALELEHNLVSEAEIVLHYTARIWSQEADVSRRSYSYAHVFYEVAYGGGYVMRDGSMPHGCAQIPSEECGPNSGIYSANPVNIDLQVQGIISAVSNALLRTAVATKGVSLQVRMVPMPPVSFNPEPDPQADVASRGQHNDSLMLWIIMFPIITMLLVPSLCSMLASEKENGMLETIQLEGGRVDSYFIGTAGFCFCYSAAFNALFVITLVATGAAASGSGVHVPAWESIVLIVSGAVALTGFVLFIGFCGYGVISKARNAALYGIMVVLMSVMVG